MIRKRIALGALSCGVALSALSMTGCSEPKARTFEHLSPVYTLDREYRSMKGPSSVQEILLPEAETQELAWITGYRAVMVGADGGSPVSQEYMCHSNLDFDQIRHAKLFNEPIYHHGRLFTLSQGQFDIKLPEGFGLPYYTDEGFSLTTQVLNLNPDGVSRDVRHKITLEYLLDRDLEEPMKPLFMTSGWGLVSLGDDAGHYGVSDPSEEEHGESCLPGQVAGTDNYTDEFGREFSGHWVVKPGREVDRTLITKIMNIPYDTTVHYIAVHLHPFAESLELIDLTSGETVFKSNVENSKERLGLDRVEYFSSVEGVPVYRDHEYQLVSVYNNTTEVDQDSMAVMLLYMYDKQFRKTVRRPVESPVVPVDRPLVWGDEQIVLHTSLGDVTIGLYRNAAPSHYEKLLELARIGIFDTMNFDRVESYLVQTSAPGKRRSLTEEQRNAIRPLQAEFTDVEFLRGSVGMVLQNYRDAHSAEARFFITLDRSDWLDGRRTVVGRVLEGMEIIDRMTDVKLKGNRPVEPIVIESTEVAARPGLIAQH